MIANRQSHTHVWRKEVLKFLVIPLRKEDFQDEINKGWKQEAIKDLCLAHPECVCASSFRKSWTMVKMIFIQLNNFFPLPERRVDQLMLMNFYGHSVRQKETTHENKMTPKTLNRLGKNSWNVS